MRTRSAFRLTLALIVCAFMLQSCIGLWEQGQPEPNSALSHPPSASDLNQMGDVEVINSPLDKFLQSPNDTVISDDMKAKWIITKDAEPLGSNPANFSIKYFEPSTAGYKIGGVYPALGYSFESKGTVLVKPVYVFFNVANEPPGTTPAVLVYSSGKVLMPLAVQLLPKADFRLGVALNVGEGSTTILVWDVPLSVLSLSTGGAAPAKFGVTLPNPGDQTVGAPFNETATLGGEAVADIAGYWSHAVILSGPAAISSPAAGASSVSGMFQCESPGAALIEYAAIYSWNEPVLNQKTGKETTEHFGDTYWGTTGNFSCIAAKVMTPIHVHVVSVSDAGHNFNDVGLPFDFNVKVGDGNIIVAGDAPWVTVTGPWNPDGSFKATGTGIVAGKPGIRVELDGTFSQKDGLAGDYTMGVGGGLGHNRAITYHLKGQPVEAAAGGAASAGGTASPAGTATPAMQDFLAQLTAALRTNDAAFLLQHLHPAAIGVYSAQTCQAHFQQRSPDPTYNLEVTDVTGPASWVYAPAGQAQVPVENVYTVNANETQQGKTNTVALHIGQVGDQFYWFTACQ